MTCARCRNSTVEGKSALCSGCYEAFTFVSLNPDDVKVWYAVRDLLKVKDWQVLKDVADSAGGTELTTLLMSEKDVDTKLNWLKKEVNKL